MNQYQGLLVASLLALCSVGCALPTTTTGWSFQVGKPATMASHAAIAQGPGTMALYPVASYPAAPPSRGASLAALAAESGSCLPCPSGVSSAGGSLAALAPSCDLPEVCRRLERLERRLGGSPGLSTPPARPLPPGPASE